MNWFTIIVVVLGALLLGYLVLEVVRPRRSRVDDSARLREKHQGEDFYRGGGSATTDPTGGSGF